MKKLNPLFIVLIFFCFQLLHAQPWEKIIGGPVSNIAHNLSYDYRGQLGGVLMHTKPSGNWHPTIVSFNSKGDSIFTKEISLDSLGSPAYITDNDARIDGLGNRIVFGQVDYTVNQTGSNREWFVIKFDSIGNLTYFKRLIYNYMTPIRNRVVISKTNDMYHFMTIDSITNATAFYYSHLLIQEIRKYNVNGSLVWKKRWTQPDTSFNSINNWRIGFITNPVELASGEIFYYRWDTTMVGGARLELMATNGQALNSYFANNYLNPSSQILQSLGSSDTVLNILGWRNDPTNSSTQQGFVLRVKPNGQIIDSLISSNIYYNSITQKTNGDLLISFSNYTNPNGIIEGVIDFDKHFNLKSVTPAQSLSCNSSRLFSNNSNGCFMAKYDHINYKHPTLICNYDSLFNIYPSKLTGSVCQDNNKDCAFNSGDLNLAYRSIVCTDAQNNNFYSYSNGSGNYTVAVPNNNYTVTHSPGQYKSIMCPSLNPVYSFNNNTFNQNFFDTITPNINDLKISLVSDPFWVGGNGYITAMYENVGTKTVSANIKLIKDAALSFSFSTPSPNNISADTITYNVLSIAPDTIGFVTLCLTPSSNLSFGTSLNFKTIISNTLSDVDLTNNQDSLSNTFYGALRISAPSLSVSTSNNINVNKPLYISAEEELTYKIRFQNTSGSEVKNVMIIDTLSSYLDYSTLRFLKASAPYALSLSPNGKLIITFNNINLQDSALNENASKGFIIFRIRPKANWPVGKKIHNQANIYFDYFNVITTNQTNNIRLKDVGINKIYSNLKPDIRIYPNPSNGYFIIDKSDIITIQNIEVFSVSGQKVLSKTIEANSNFKTIDISILENGFYILRLNTTHGMISKKIIIEK